MEDPANRLAVESGPAQRAGEVAAVGPLHDVEGEPLQVSTTEREYADRLFHTLVERELMLPSNLTKQPVNYVRPNHVTEGYAPDGTVVQLRAPPQRIADRTDALMDGEEPPESTARQG